MVKKTKAKNPRCKNPKILFKIFGILLHSRPKFDIIKMIYINFGGGNTVETVAHNLSVLRQRGASVSERRLAHISEAAKLLASELEDGISVFENDAFISAYRELARSAFESWGDNGDTPEENRERIVAVSAEDAVNSAIFLCSDICRLMRERGTPLKFFDFFPQNTDPVSGARIAYLRNPYSDTAFGIFSEVIKNPSVSLPRDFAGVCEEVYYGRCRYCILPVETSDEGALSGFRRLIAKYELCPVLSCSVSTANGTQTTRFSLFAKNMERITERKKGDGFMGQEVFSFRLDAPTEASINKTVKALNMYGLRILTVNSAPVAWDEGRYSFEFSAECDGELDAMLLYLTLEIPEYTPIGLYLKVAARDR